MVVDPVGHSTPCSHLNARMLCPYFGTRLFLHAASPGQTLAGDKIASGTLHEERKNGAPLPVWSRSLACGNTVSGAAAAYCFDIHTRRALAIGGSMVTLSGTSRPVRLCSASTTRLLVPEDHRYVRVLDWTVAHESRKDVHGGVGNLLQVQAGVEGFRLFLRVVNGHSR
jgi:hypothetical protein